MNTKTRLYLYEDYANEDKRILLLTDEQVSVLFWLIDQGWDIHISLLGAGEEIKTNVILLQHGL